MTSVTYTELVSARQWRAQEVAKVLRKRGAEMVRMKGSHAVWRYQNCQTVVPMHRGDMPTGTVRAIERDMEPALGRGWLK